MLDSNFLFSAFLTFSSLSRIHKTLLNADAHEEKNSPSEKKLNWIPVLFEWMCGLFNESQQEPDAAK